MASPNDSGFAAYIAAANKAVAEAAMAERARALYKIETTPVEGVEGVEIVKWPGTQGDKVEVGTKYDPAYKVRCCRWAAGSPRST